MINKDFSVKKEIKVKANKKRVWEALTNPEITQEYFFGTQVLSSWKINDPILFKGEFNGQSFEDKGVILNLEKGHSMKYSYYSAFSGLPDSPENYSLVSYKLTEQSDNSTLLELIQVGFANEEAHKHSLIGWEQVLEQLKAYVEQN